MVNPTLKRVQDKLERGSRKLFWVVLFCTIAIVCLCVALYGLSKTRDSIGADDSISYNYIWASMAISLIFVLLIQYSIVGYSHKYIINAAKETNIIN
jgi:uncharacterized membrane protein YhaH (DUF805 family)